MRVGPLGISFLSVCVDLGVWDQIRVGNELREGLFGLLLGGDEHLLVVVAVGPLPGDHRRTSVLAPAFSRFAALVRLPVLELPVTLEWVSTPISPKPLS